jgi:hypothetical protein
VQNQRVRKSASRRAYRNAMTADSWIEPTSRRSTRDVGDDRPGWQLAKIAGGAVAAAFACGFVVRRAWLPSKIITGAVAAIGAVLAVGTRSSALRAVGSGAMAWATGQLGLCLVDDVLRGRLRAQVARALQPMESTSVDGLPPDALVRAFARARAKLAMLGLCGSHDQARASPVASPDRHRAASPQADADMSTGGNVHGSTTAHASAAPPSQGELESSLVRPGDSETVITVDVKAPATADRADGSPTWIEFASESSSHAWPTGMELAKTASHAAWPTGGDSTVDRLAPQTSPTVARSPMTTQSDPAGTGVGSSGASLDRTIHTPGSDSVPP